MENREIPNGWREATLGEVVTSANTGLDAIKRAPIVDIDTGIKCFRIQDASQSKSYGNWGFTEVSQSNFEKFQLKKGDILIARTGNTIGVHYFVKDNLNAVYNNGIIRLRIKPEFDCNYIYKVISSDSFKRYIQSIAYGTSTQPNMQINALLDFKFLIPDYNNQVAISDILVSLDEKIELLEEENKTLETLAQTIFTEWFVNFNFPGATVEMEDSELGEIPKGWRVGKLGEITTVKSGFAFKSNDFVDESNFKALKIKDLKGKGNIDVSNLSCVSEEITQLDRVKYFKLSGGDIVVAMSGNTTGKIGILPETSLEIYLNQRVGKFFVENKSINNFLYTFLITNNYEDKILSMSYGSAQPNISPVLIENIKLVLPTQDIFNKFLELINPIFCKISANKTQVETLKLMRDTLLPDLTSGKMRVKGFGE